MQNLLITPFSEADLAGILAATAGRPALPPLGDSAWNTVRDNPAVTRWLPPFTGRATAEADEPLPILTDELYADFFKTGSRLPFERVYFARRCRLARAAMAILLGDAATHARLLPSFIRKLGEVMDETSWALPAHVWTEPTGKDPMTIDLSAAETANTFAEILAAFAAVIPAELTGRIRSRLRIQFFENYLDRQPPFHWSTLPTNWNAVCHQGVLGAALAIENDHDLVARLLARAAHVLPIFLSGFGDDGSTSEGPGYWSYGFGWFSELNAQLEHRTRGELSFFEGDRKIARIARFAPLMTFSGGHFVNFSDGPRTGWLSPSLLAYLGHRLSDPLLTGHGAVLYRHVIEAGLEVDEHRSDFFSLTRLALRAPAVDKLAATPDPAQPDVYFRNYGAMSARGTDTRGNRWEFAAKGGHNAEHHNHNDCGSFILNLNGCPAIIEIGAPEYVGDYFNSDKTRYTFLAARSLGHSVPLVNGCEQSVGAEFAAAVLEYELGARRVRFAVDLTECYPAEARCRKLVRTFVFEKTAGRLEVSDAFELDGPGLVESVMICEEAVLHEPGGVQINAPGGRLQIVPAQDTEFSGGEFCSYRDRNGAEQHVHRLRFRPRQPTAAATVGYHIVMA